MPGGRKFATLNSLGEGDGGAGGAGHSSGDDEDAPRRPDDRQSFYVGGSEHSGQAVLGPRRGDIEKDMRDLLEKARQHGAEPVTEEQPTSSNKKPHAFMGKGRRLGAESDNTTHGDDDDEVEIIEESNSGGEPNVLPVTLRLYSNGFTLNDGELRSYEDPNGKLFMASIKQGRIPSELIQMYPGREIDLRIEPHIMEAYKPVLRPFAGQGMRLGAVVPETADDVATATSVTQAVPPKSTPTGPEKVDVEPIDEKEPTTQVQVRLANGRRLIVRTNLNSTVMLVREAIVRAHPEYETCVFRLMTTFPNKEIDDENQTIEEAKLQGAVVVQKLVN